MMNTIAVALGGNLAVELRPEEVNTIFNLFPNEEKGNELCYKDSIPVTTGAFGRAKRMRLVYRVRDELRQWCEENLGPHEFTTYQEHPFLLTTSDRDAVLFKLRWG